MAARKATSSGITRKDLDSLLACLSDAEKELFRDLVREGEPQEAVRLAEIMHYLDARLVEE